MSQDNTNREKKIRSILERSSDIDAQTLQKYIDKKLTKEEMHEVEKQLLNSDFAAEAVEGFSNADFKVNIVASTKQLNKEIKEYNKKRGFYKTDYRVFYAAASVALVFVVLFGLFKLADSNFSNNELAMETQPTSLPQAEPTQNENLALQEERQLEHKTEKELIKKLKSEDIEEFKTDKNSNQTTKINENNLALNKDEITTEQDFSTSDVWITKKEKIDSQHEETTNYNLSPIVSASRQMNFDSSSSTNLDQLVDDDYNLFSDNRKEEKQNKKSSKDILFDAIQAYENKKYTEANLLFDTYLVTYPNDAQALYFGGISYYQNQIYKKAIPLLEKFLNQKSGIIYQKNSKEAEWSLANAYLKANQKQKAKSLLQKIANSNTTYSNQAKSLLKE